MQFDYRVSVIVPIYNQEPYLVRTVESLLKQTMNDTDYEIILVDDGSTDSSPMMCDIFAETFDNIKVIHKENGGLSDARNCGIDHAKGKYLMYLDGDDTLKEDTLEAVASFFDKHYEEVDLVTYPSVSIRNGEQSQTHYRYSTLKSTGIYDLTREENIYAAVTRIEVCVKNAGADNVKFSANRNFRHEDQKYCIDVILKKLKIGFCNAGAYYYEQQPDGLQNTYFYAYYLFEPTMEFWEEEFAKFEDKVPHYLQALYISDVAWKLKSSMLVPYHYNEQAFNHAVSRIDALLARVDVEVIANHPTLDQYQTIYWLRRKRNCVINCLSKGNTLSLIADDMVVFHRKRVEIILLRTQTSGSKISLYGFLKSPCFQFLDKPRLLVNAYQDGSNSVHEINLSESSWNYLNAKVKTDSFWNFDFEFQPESFGSFDFVVEVNGTTLQADLFFMPRAVFSNNKPKRLSFVRDGFEFKFEDNTFFVSRCNTKNMLANNITYEPRIRITATATRAIVQSLRKTGRRIWLYCDCHGVEKNNAYYQYMHDIEIDDGIERYYVINDPIETKKHLFTDKQVQNVVQFHSRKHQLLFLVSECVITAYAERANWIPFGINMMRNFEDLFRGKVIYLQHGVLHSHQPWKYSRDRLLIDAEVISTQFERDNLCNNYCFDDTRLIMSGMPRYDFIDAQAKPSRKILLAPSWRKFLVRQKADGQWLGVPKIFQSSQFYQETLKLINDVRLFNLLEQYDYTLEVKLHPIISELYKPFLKFDNPRVKSADETVDDGEYAIFITDFSSYRFDFVYLKRAIVYFFPDEEMFLSGMCDYRETDLPLDGTFGDMARTTDEAIECLAELLANDAKPKQKYAEQMDDFFLYYDNNQRDRIYEAIISRVL